MKTLTHFFNGYNGTTTVVDGFKAFLQDNDLEQADMSLAITGEHPEGLQDLTEAIIDSVDRERIIDQDQGIEPTYQEVYDLTVLNWLLANQSVLVKALDAKPVPKTYVSDSKGNGTSLYERDKAYVNTYSRMKDHRAAVRAYCGDNKWAIENAKGTGNW